MDVASHCSALRSSTRASAACPADLASNQCCAPPAGELATGNTDVSRSLARLSLAWRTACTKPPAGGTASAQRPASRQRVSQRRRVRARGREGSRAWMVDYNPAAAFIETFQNPLVYHKPASLLAYGLTIGTTAFLVLVACLMIRYLSKRVIFHM